MTQAASQSLERGGPPTYRLETGWAKVPAGKAFRQASSVAIDKNDNVYVFNRSDNPVMIFDRKGNYIDSWGQGTFVRPHGIFIGKDDAVYCTDDGDHTVRKYSLDGKLLMTIGTPGVSTQAYCGHPFNRCTHTALSPENDIYVSDGYANARVHKYSPEGKLITSWGEPGVQPGQFNIPHNVCCDDEGWVYVADRENHRIQVFDGNGRFEAQWHNLHRPAWISVKAGNKPLFFVAELQPDMDINRDTPNLGPRISIMTGDGKFVSQIHTTMDNGPLPEPFAVPHGIEVDSHGDIYVADLAQRTWVRTHPNTPEPVGFETIKKLVRV